MKRFVPIALALLAGAGIAGGAAAASQEEERIDGRRINRIIVFGNDACPPSTAEEIVVCARQPENDRFRIPPSLRGANSARNSSWAVNARTLETAGRTGIQSCSTVGPNGFTGCWAEMMRQHREGRDVDTEGQPVP